MKKTFLYIFLLGLIGCTPKIPYTTSDVFFTPEPPPTQTCAGIKIATLNAEFMFDGIGDEGQATFPHKGNPEKAQEHRARIATIIKRINPDILVLEEVENENTLSLLLAEQFPESTYQIYFVEGRDTFTGQDVAILSKLPIDEIGRSDDRAKEGDTEKLYGVSKNIYARLTIKGQPITLIGVHFLSQASNPDRRDRREAQAEVIRRMVQTEISFGRAVMVLGDFNDYDDTTADLQGSVPVTNVLKIIKSASPETPADDLQNLIAEIPQKDRFTALWDQNNDGLASMKEFTAIDHILISPSLYRFVQEVDYVQSHNPFEFTDHFPVTACFQF